MEKVKKIQSYFAEQFHFVLLKKKLDTIVMYLPSASPPRTTRHFPLYRRQSVTNEIHTKNWLLLTVYRNTNGNHVMCFSE